MTKSTILNFNHNRNCPNTSSIGKVTHSIQSYFLLRKIKEILVCILFGSKTKLCINTIQFWYFQYQSLSPRSPRVLWLTPGSRVRTVLCSLRFLCSLGPQSLLQPRVTADLHRHKHRSIIKKERWRHFCSSNFHNCASDPGSLTAVMLLTTLCSVYTLLIHSPVTLWPLLWLRGKSGHCLGARLCLWSIKLLSSQEFTRIHLILSDAHPVVTLLL